jgi:hypothetical protein
LCLSTGHSNTTADTAIMASKLKDVENSLSLKRKPTKRSKNVRCGKKVNQRKTTRPKAVRRKLN